MRGFFEPTKEQIMIKNIENEEKLFLVIAPQTNGYHSLHRDGCPFMPDENKRIDLGRLFTGRNVIAEGQKYFEKVNVCRFCLQDHSEDELHPVFSEPTTRNYLPTVAQIAQYVNGTSLYYLN